MLPLALTTLEKLQKVPPHIWVNAGAGLLVIILGIALVRGALQRMNKWVLLALIIVLCTVLCFNWVWERNEPKFLKPLIDMIAPWFPNRHSFTGHW